jgi:hypothetical protein
VFSPFTDIPEGRYLLDPFVDAAIDSEVWGSSISVGSTIVSAPGATGKIEIKNAGAGTLGASYLPTSIRFGKHNRISVDIELDVGSAGADGNHADAGLELWADADNYIIAGPYRDTVGALNDQLVVYGKSSGVAFGPTALMSIITDAVRHTVTYGITEGRVLVFFDGVKIWGKKMPSLRDYEVRLVASTTANADKITAWFYDFEVANQFDALPLVLGTNLQSVLSQVSILNSRLTAGRAGYLDLLAASLVTPPSSGSMSIVDASANLLEFTTAVFGSVFDLSIALDVSGARLDYCRLDDGGAFDNQDLVAKGLSVGDVLIVPDGGAAHDDAIYFGLSENSHRLDVVMLGGSYNTDNEFVWEYWDGGAWAALTVTDGTIASVNAFGKSGSVTWTEDLGSTDIDGVTAYWVRARVDTAGADLPVGSHMQFSPLNAVDFDSLAVMGNYLKVEVYRKVGATYPAKPSDVWEYQQCNISKIIEIALRCYSDTKIVITSEVSPTAAVTLPYTYTTMRYRV